MFLPLISVGNGKPDLPLNSHLRTYFYFHKIAGYILSSYVLAALGLGK